MIRRGVVPVFIPHRGCPNDCRFCNQHAITGSPSAMPQDIPKLVDGITHRFDLIEVAFYGGSFTAIPANERKAYLKVAKSLKDSGRIQGIRCSTRPDALDDDKVRELLEYDVDRVEIGVQSTDDAVLEANGRGCTTQDAREAVARLRAAGVKVGVQLMAGLPGATYASDVQSAVDVVSWQPDFTRVYPTVVLGGTALERDFKNGSYHPMDLAEAVQRCAGMAEVFYSADIPIIRIGLQEAGDDMVAGPFHPAMRDLVDNAYVIEGILKRLKAADIYVEDGLEGVTIFHPKAMVSVIVGQNKCGMERLRAFHRHVRLECWEKTDIGICLHTTKTGQVWLEPVIGPVKEERQ